MALTDPARSHLTLVVEKVAFAASTCLHNGLPYETADENATFSLGGSYAALTELRAWYTHYSDGRDGLPTVIFEQLPALPVVDGAVSLTIRVGDVWTLSTISNATKASVPASPPKAPFPVPYTSDFEGVTPPRAPPLWTDQGGAFEAWASGDPAHGVTLRQMVPVHPISWGAVGETSDGITPHTILGDGRWTDVNISASFMIEAGGGADPAAGTPGAMVGARASGNINSMSGVWLAVNASGGWNVSLSSGTIALPGVQLASGPCAAVPPGTWHVLTLNVSGRTAAGALDSVPLFSGLDVMSDGTASRAGWAALGTTDYGYVQFDDVSVNGRDNSASIACDPSGNVFGSRTNISVWRCDDTAARTAFDWIPAPGQNSTMYGPPGFLSLRGGDGSGVPICLGIAGVQAPSGWPLIQLMSCNTTTLPEVNLLWVLRSDNMVMSTVPWGQPASFPCLTMDGDAWSFGDSTYVEIRDCGSLSTMLFNWDPVSGQISSEWLSELCVAACAANLPTERSSRVTL